MSRRAFRTTAAESKQNPKSTGDVKAQAVVVKTKPKQRLKRSIIARAPQNTPQSIETMTDEMRKKTRRKVMKNRFGPNAGILSKLETNMYLKTLVDPETYQGVRYPDEFGRKTGVVPAILNHDVYVFPSRESLNYVEDPGFYLNVCTPSMSEPLLEYTLQTPTSSSTSSRVRGYLNTQGKDYGLFPVDETQVSWGVETGMLLLNKGEFNLRAPWFLDEDGDVGTICPPFRGVGPSNGIFYGAPVLKGDSDSDSMVVTLISNTPASGTGVSLVLFARLVTELGSVQKGFSYTDGSVTLSASFTAAELESIMTSYDGGSCFSVGLPGMGVQIVNTSFAVSLNSLSWSFYPRTTEFDIPVFKVITLPDVDTYIKKVDQYRPISASVWMEYQGADLTNGGQAAAIMYRGGRPFSLNGLWDYQKVAETPGGYQGALKLGSYSFWLPATAKDVLMRQIGSTSRWDRPYIVNVGQVASPDLPHVLRMRIPMNFEHISSAQFFAYASAEIHPEWIEQAAVIVRNIPTSMENPLHLGFIKDLAGGLLNKGVDGLAGIAKGILGSIF